MSEPLLVLSFGACTPVGLSAPASCAAIRAGISALAESEFFHDEPGLEPIRAAAVPGRAEESDFDRLVALALPALGECAASLGVDPKRTALLLSIREPHRTGSDLDGRQAELLKELRAKSGLDFHAESAVLPEGSAGVLKALRAASALLAGSRVDACVVGGADSLLNGEDVLRLRSTWRLAGPKVAQGLFPGEGACFLGVARKLPPGGKPARGRILGVGLGEEPEATTVLKDGAATGRGLQKAMEAALADAGLAEGGVGFRVSDLNGEAYRGMESMLAGTRFFRTRRESFEIWHPADCVGDLGAAAGALLPIVAITALEKGYAPEKTAVCEASSEARLRGACLVAPGGERR